MPELMIDHITSLDGFGSAQGWPGLWGLGGPEYVGWLEHDGATPRTLLLGATTYRLFAQLAADEPEAMAALTDRPKIVFSRTLGTPLSWANTTLVDQDAVAAVAALKGYRATPCGRWAVQAWPDPCCAQASWTGCGSWCSRW